MIPWVLYYINSLHSLAYLQNVNSSAFWDLTISNVVTWLILAIGFLTSQIIALKVMTRDIKELRNWKIEHEGKSDGRDKMLNELTVAIERLTTLVSTTHDRLNRLEEHEDYGKVFLNGFRDEIKGLLDSRISALLDKSAEVAVSRIKLNKRLRKR